jgi:hypothetical protein
MKQTKKNRTKKMAKKKTTPAAAKPAARRAKLSVKNTVLLLAIGLCAGIVIEPHLPPDVAEWAAAILKWLVSGSVRQWAERWAA